MTSAIHWAVWEQIDPVTSHDILRLRVNVFVVEQQCPYPEIDGLDVEPSTQHVWVADSDLRVASYLRVLAGPQDDAAGALRVGRVVTHPSVRGRGLSARLMTHVLARHPGAAVIIEAQSHLADWYGRFGFVVTGPEFDLDGIPHVPMRGTSQSYPQ